jgi:hypothetical protein
MKAKAGDMANHSSRDRIAIDAKLRERVTDKIGIMTRALDAVTVAPTNRKLDELRAAADHLMRAVGRVLIEIEFQRGSRRSNHH